jgi:hypothetical protein
MEQSHVRALISPFCIRRTLSSTWIGQWVIKKTVARPVPEILLPFSDFGSEKNAIAGHSDNAQLRIGTFEYIERADKLRFLAWTPIWARIADDVCSIQTKTPGFEKPRNLRECDFERTVWKG